MWEPPRGGGTEAKLLFSPNVLCEAIDETKMSAYLLTTIDPMKNGFQNRLFLQAR